MKRPNDAVGQTHYPPRYLPSEDPIKFAWRGLRRFHNANALAVRVMKQRKIPEAHGSNVKKQMLQLRHCLLQAKEYFDAAEVVSLSTKGVQLYYCCMSLALAQILWKETGDVSLDKMRAQHRHHGLEFGFPARIPQTLETAADQMIARPYSGKVGERGGTFELWHRAARQLPFVGLTKTRFLSGGVQTELQTLLATIDRQLPKFEASGISLLHCLQHTPTMIGHLATLGIETHLVRATLGLNVFEQQDGSERYQYSLIVQPGNSGRIAEMQEAMGFDPNGVDHIDVNEFPSGFLLSWNYNANTRFPVQLPEGFSVNPVEIELVGHDPPLNEFGYLYVGLYICGMFSRYYPDLWQKEIETSSDLSICIEFFLEAARERLALLTLMELESTYFVPRVMTT